MAQKKEVPAIIKLIGYQFVFYGAVIIFGLVGTGILCLFWLIFPPKQNNNRCYLSETECAQMYEAESAEMDSAWSNH